MDGDDSPVLRQPRIEWLDDAGLEVRRRNLDTAPEHSQDTIGRSRFYMHRRVGAADRIQNRQADIGSVELCLDAEQVEELAQVVAVRILVVVDIPEEVVPAAGDRSMTGLQHTRLLQLIIQVDEA